MYRRTLLQLGGLLRDHSFPRPFVQKRGDRLVTRIPAQSTRTGLPYAWQLRRYRSGTDPSQFQVQHTRLLAYLLQVYSS